MSHCGHTADLRKVQMDTVTTTAALVTRVQRSEIKNYEQAVVAMVRLMSVQFPGLLGSEIIQPNDERPEFILVQRLVDIETANSYLNSELRKKAIEQFCADLQISVSYEVCPIDRAPKHRSSFQPRPVHWSQTVQNNALEIWQRLMYGQPIEKVEQDFSLGPQEAKELYIAVRLDDLTKSKRTELLNAAVASEEDARNWSSDLLFLAQLQAWRLRHGAPDEKVESAISNIVRFTPTQTGYDEKERVRTELFKLMGEVAESFEKAYPMDSPIEEILKSMASYAKSKKLEVSTTGDGTLLYRGETMTLTFIDRRLKVCVPDEFIVSNHAVGSFDIVGLLDLKQINPRFIWQSEDFDDINSKVLARALLTRFMRAVDRKLRGEPQAADPDSE